jgi:hypothetical protein
MRWLPRRENYSPYVSLDGRCGNKPFLESLPGSPHMRHIEHKKSEPQIGPGPVQEFPVGNEVDLDSRFSVVLDCEEAKSKNSNKQKRIYRIWPEWLGFIVVIVTYGLSAWLTWRKWPDLLVDFGEQLYLPWRISVGSVLYRDVMYLTGGPLSQYYHAGLFKLFGVSFLTLIVSNLAIGLGLLLLMYRRFVECADAMTSTTICVGVILVLAFGQYSDIGNYNFVTPYCHEVWHGVVLSILAISFLASWLQKERAIFAMGSGFCAGLVFLTKPDVFTALMLSFAAAYIIAVKLKGFRAVSKLFVWSFGSAILPLLVFLIYFRQFESWQDSARSVVFAWVPLLTTSVSKEVFYKWCMGLDVPGFHIRKMIMQFLIVSAVMGTCAIWFRREMKSSPRRLVTVAFVALSIALASGVDWVDSGRALPLLVLTLCILLGVRYKSLLNRAVVTGCNTLRNESFTYQSLTFPLLWSIFGLGLLAKLGLFSRIWHYGFILAMPAFAAAIFLLLWYLPGVLERYGVRRQLLRSNVWLILMTAFVRLFVQSQNVMSTKTLAVGNGQDKVFTFNEKTHPAGPAVQSALAWLESNASPNATLAVLPEGVMVNFLSRRFNPTKYLIWNPAEIVGFGQSTMTATFCENPPDYVMLIHRDSSEYGVKFFGQEERFGLKLMQWIQANYEPVCLIGNEPLRNSLFGIKILKRITVNPTK